MRTERTRDETQAGRAGERESSRLGRRLAWRGGAHTTCSRCVDALALARADQDEQLDDLARVVTNTRHIALAVNDELDLHARLLVRACCCQGKWSAHPLTACAASSPRAY